MKKESKISIFWACIKKLAHPLFGAWLVLLVHVQFTPSEGLKNFENYSYHESKHGSVTVKFNHGKGHFTWDNFMVHDVNSP